MSSIFTRMRKLVCALRGQRVAPARIKRILVAHQLLLGDTLLLAPLLKELRRAHPDAELVMTVRPALMPLFDAKPYGVSAIAFSRRDDRSQRAVIDSGPYDLAIVPDDNRYAWLARAAGARWIMGFADDRPNWKNWMLDDARPYPQQASAWADLLAPTFLGSEPRPFAQGEWPAPLRPAGLDRSSKYAVLHVGASSRLKSWPAQRWNQIAQHLRGIGYQLVFSGAKSESAWLEGIEAEQHELRHFGRLDLAGLWHLLADADLLICPDTGIAHLARLTGVTTFAMFGPGSALLHGAGRFWATSPFRALTLEPFPCRDQQSLYRREVGWVRRCGRGEGSQPGQCPQALCMQALPVAMVRAGIDAVSTSRRLN